MPPALTSSATLPSCRRSACTGCTLRINATHVGSLVNGDTTTGWENTNNYAAVVDSTEDAVLKVWTQVSHDIEGNHTAGESGWIGTPGNHIPPPFGLIGNVIAYHNSTPPDGNSVAVVSTSVGNPRAATWRPTFMVYTSLDFSSWSYSHTLYTHPTAMSRAECGDFFPIGAGAQNVAAANVDFGKAAADAVWVLMWSRPVRNGAAAGSRGRWVWCTLWDGCAATAPSHRPRRYRALTLARASTPRRQCLGKMTSVSSWPTSAVACSHCRGPSR
jgi:hypothetical protein